VQPASVQLDQAVRRLREGGLVAFPTETVYGLGARAFDAAAVAGVFAAKSRPSSNPLIVHVASVEMAQRVTRDWSEEADRMARAFWPGPMSLVLFKAQALPQAVTAGGQTVCVRMPAHPLAIALIDALDEPIVGPSANRSGRISPTTAAHVHAEFPDVLVLDGGPCRVGIESTVVDLCGPEPMILRPGAVSAEQVQAVLGRAVSTHASVEPTSQFVRSPGTAHRHYAPRTPVVLVDTYAQAPVESRPEVVLTQRPGLLPAHATVILMPISARDYAATLYDTLRRADALESARIVIERPQTSGGEDASLWAAVLDRLTRAAARDEMP
jgi:L-threonylcarbamoyladenylate synthase